MRLHSNTAEDTESVGARLARALPRAEDASSAGARPDSAMASGADALPIAVGPSETAAASAGIATGLTIIYLLGDLGAGKTTLARGFLRALGVKGAVRSPTYTLVEVYDTGPITVLHLDLYRLRDPEELEHLGLREWARPGHVWLIEWPDRGGTFLPPPDLSVQLLASEGRHDIEVTAQTLNGEGWLARFGTLSEH